MFHILVVASALSLEPTLSAEMPATTPGSIEAQLLDSQSLLAFAKGCSESRSYAELDRSIHSAEMQQFSLRRRTQLIWGGGEELSYKLALVNPLQRRCSRKNVQNALAEMSLSLSTFETQLLAYERLESNGVWLGPIRLCRKSVAAVAKGVDELTHTPVILFEMTDEGTAQLAAFTKQVIRDEVAVRLSGAVISSPHVHEPLLSGKFQIPAPQDQLQVESILELAAQPC
jgi:preprotein translocase subunit SecD